LKAKWNTDDCYTTDNYGDKISEIQFPTNKNCPDNISDRVKIKSGDNLLPEWRKCKFRGFEALLPKEDTKDSNAKQ